MDISLEISVYFPSPRGLITRQRQQDAVLSYGTPRHKFGSAAYLGVFTCEVMFACEKEKVSWYPSFFPPQRGDFRVWRQSQTSTWRSPLSTLYLLPSTANTFFFNTGLFCAALAIILNMKIYKKIELDAVNGTDRETFNFVTFLFIIFYFILLLRHTRPAGSTSLPATSWTEVWSLWTG